MTKNMASVTCSTQCVHSSSAKSQAPVFQWMTLRGVFLLMVVLWLTHGCRSNTAERQTNSEMVANSPASTRDQQSETTTHGLSNHSSNQSQTAKRKGLYTGMAKPRPSHEKKITSDFTAEGGPKTPDIKLGATLQPYPLHGSALKLQELTQTERPDNSYVPHLKNKSMKPEQKAAGRLLENGRVHGNRQNHVPLRNDVITYVRVEPELSRHTELPSKNKPSTETPGERLYISTPLTSENSTSHLGLTAPGHRPSLSGNGDDYKDTSTGCSAFGGRSIFNEAHLQKFQLGGHFCRPGFVADMYASEAPGEILGLSGTVDDDSRSSWSCVFRLTVPPGRFIVAVQEYLCGSTCSHYLMMTAGDSLPEAAHLMQDAYGLFGPYDDDYKESLIFTSSNEVYFFVSSKGYFSGPLFRIRFSSTAEIMQRKLSCAMTSSREGFITSPGLEQQWNYPKGMNASHLLRVPENHVVMISFPVFWLNVGPVCENPSQYYTPGFVALYQHGQTGDKVELWRKCGFQAVDTQVYSHNLTIVFFSVARGRGFKIVFSFHATSRAPVQIGNGLFNCSVPYYPDFKHHLDCTLKQECQGKEDEHEYCPFSSHFCNGDVAASDRKCYRFVPWEFEDTWRKARLHCQAMGMDLATMTSEEEWRVFYGMFQPYGRLKPSCAYVGIVFSNCSLPHGYKGAWLGTDGIVSHEANITDQTSAIALTCDNGNELAARYFVRRPFTLSVMSADFQMCEAFVCQYGESQIPPSANIVFPSVNLESILSSQRVPLVRCLIGHVTRDFLTCDSESHCDISASYLAWCPVNSNRNHQHGSATEAAPDRQVMVAMFACYDEMAKLPYTLVCDFKRDCRDGSDESFCYYVSDCRGFSCESGQCIPQEKRCDYFHDCWDRSDEKRCQGFSINYWPLSSSAVQPPVIISANSSNTYSKTKMPSAQACPETHFRCPGEPVYCLPVYNRCNGVYDCPNQEDEVECQEWECPGFYRCRASVVCLHVSHVCDGFPQCPGHDDELLCGFTCPVECLCQGLALVCPRRFPAHVYPEIRYLDARGSQMTPADLTANVYLVRLNLANCNLSSVTNMTLRNLQHLDLSENMLISISMDQFSKLPNLRVLILAGNPLRTIVSGYAKFKQAALQKVDFSRSEIQDFDSHALASYPNIRLLNISFCKLGQITENGFKDLRSLVELDLKGNRIHTYPPDLFRGMKYLRYISVNNYRLCCKGILPEGFDEEFCFSPQDELSSCEDLLRSNMYRLSLWLMCAMSVVGNLGCIVLRCVVWKSVSTSGFAVFIANLSVADMLMGIYLAVLGFADDRYRGNYVWHELTWRSSWGCKMAGFLSFLSSEVSAFTICLITVDRFMVMRFPLSGIRFGKRSAALACGLAWLVGLGIVSVPLLPMTSHWQFYGQSGICIPLPITRQTFQGHSFSFGVMIVLNFVLFVLIAVGQAMIYYAIRGNSFAADEGRKAQDAAVAKHLATIVMSDFLCWFPIGLLGLLASTGVPVSGELNVVMAVYILPVNSALNPFLYTINLLLDRRRKRHEARLLRWLESRAASKTKVLQDSDAVNTGWKGTHETEQPRGRFVES